MERIAQRMEVRIEDFETIVRILMRNGYQVLCSQDGESEDIVIINYLNPLYSGHYFGEIES